MRLLLLCTFFFAASALRNAREEEGSLHAKVETRSRPKPQAEASLVSNEAPKKKSGRRRTRSSITVNSGKAAPKILDDPLTSAVYLGEDEENMNKSALSLRKNKTSFSLLETEAWVTPSSANDTARSSPTVVAFRAQTAGAAAALKSASEQARELAKETERLQMISLFDVMSATYSELPKLNWHTKWAIILCFSLILLAKGACVCLCVHTWQKRQRELAMRDAAKLVCKTAAGFGGVDEAKVAAILGGILEKEQPDDSETMEKPDIGLRSRSDSHASEPESVKTKKHAREASPGDEPSPSSRATTVGPSAPQGSVSWSMYYSENGVPCFYNPETGERTWEVPREIAELASSGTGLMHDTFQLPSGCALTDDSDDDDDDHPQNSS